jgi:hypothetical protein
LSYFIAESNALGSSAPTAPEPCGWALLAVGPVLTG